MGLLDVFRHKSPEAIRQSGFDFGRRAAMEYGRGLRDCESHFLKAYQLFHSIDDHEEMARTALGLGSTYTHIRGLRDLIKAREWYQTALANAQTDRTRAEALGSLALLELQQLSEDGKSQISPTKEDRLDTAEGYARESLGLLPEEAHISRAVTHAQLARIAELRCDWTTARYHHQQALDEYRVGGDCERIAKGLINFSSYFIGVQDLSEAHKYAQAALAELDCIPKQNRSVDWQEFRKMVSAQVNSLQSHMAV